MDWKQFVVDTKKEKLITPEEHARQLIAEERNRRLKKEHREQREKVTMSQEEKLEKAMQRSREQAKQDPVGVRDLGFGIKLLEYPESHAFVFPTKYSLEKRVKARKRRENMTEEEKQVRRQKARERRLKRKYEELMQRV